MKRPGKEGFACIEAFYARPEEGGARCLLCPRSCLLQEGERGFCGVRQVRQGRLVSLSYGRVAAAHFDPVEKKPLYHYYPGRSVLSLGTVGCSLDCAFCQNWTLSRGTPELVNEFIRPEAIIPMLSKCPPPAPLGVAYTYNEPLTWYEFVTHCAPLVRSRGYRNVLVTNGYINEEPLRALLPHVDALNVDIKAYSEDFYHRYCRGGLAAVMRTVEMAAEAGCHLEVTCLLIPGLNDDPREQEKLACHLAEISVDLPLHYSRYFPRHRMSRPSTPRATIREAVERARRHLHYVYAGNIDFPGAGDTCCPHCGVLVITRRAYETRFVGLRSENTCRACGSTLALVNPPPAGL